MDILIIDDRPDSIKTLSSELRRQELENFNINIIGDLPNPNGLMKYFNKKSKFPDLVFLDKRFGNDTSVGYTVANEIKQKSNDVKIVLMTEFDNKKDFIEIHSRGLIDGYLRKQSILNPKSLQWVLTGIESGSPYFDVPTEWINYMIEDNPQNRRLFVRKMLLKERRLAQLDGDSNSNSGKFVNSNQIEELIKERIKSINETKFARYRIDEKIRQSFVPPIPEMTWQIFKHKACGYDNSQIIRHSGAASENAINTQLTNLRNNYLEIEAGNDVLILIEALKVGIPDVVDAIESQVGIIVITYPVET